MPFCNHATLESLKVTLIETPSMNADLNCDFSDIPSNFHDFVDCNQSIMTSSNFQVPLPQAVFPLAGTIPSHFPTSNAVLSPSSITSMVSTTSNSAMLSNVLTPRLTTARVAPPVHERALAAMQPRQQAAGRRSSATPGEKENQDNLSNFGKGFLEKSSSSCPEFQGFKTASSNKWSNPDPSEPPRLPYGAEGSPSAVQRCSSNPPACSRNVPSFIFAVSNPASVIETPSNLSSNSGQNSPVQLQNTSSNSGHPTSPKSISSKSHV